MKFSKLALLLLALSIASSNLGRAEEEPEGEDSQIPINIRTTAAAWDAFRAKDYARAIENADECINRYQAAADKIEAILEQAKIELPTGTASDADQQRIHQYGILHDVATCLLIKAWVAEEQGKRGEAITSYRQIQKYSHARAAEHAGDAYWAPAEAAAQQLKKLTK